MLPKLEARIHLHNDDGLRPTRLLAFAELTVGDSFLISGIRILQQRGPQGGDPFIVFPAEKARYGDMDRWHDICHPITAEARAAALKTILDAYIQIAKGPLS